MIKEIYKQPVITLTDILKTKNGKYIGLLSNIILEYLYTNPKDLQQIPLLKLFNLLGITNNNYGDGLYYKKEISQLYDVQLASIYYFYNNTKNEYKRLIERCLNNLQSRSVLFWNKCIMIIDDENKRVYKADTETKKEILDMQKETLQYLKCRNMYELMKNPKMLKEFNKILRDEMGYNYFYAYDITIGDKAIQIEYNNVMNKSKMNNLIIDKTNVIFDKSLFIPFDNDYKTLINLLINKETKDITELLESKRKENIDNYYIDKVKLDKEYFAESKHIEHKYFDKYNK